MRFTFIAGRSTKQGQQVNIGKTKPEYLEMVSILQMNPQDLALLGVTPGDPVIVSTIWGESIFKCVPGDLPAGIVFVLYGPPTSKIMGGTTGGSGMPIQKGLEVEIKPVAVQPPAAQPEGEQLL
jgi:formylmethanofuran dehydrogenase subunit D